MHTSTGGESFCIGGGSGMLSFCERTVSLSSVVLYGVCGVVVYA